MERCVSCQYYDRKGARGPENRAAQAGLCRRSAPAMNPINAKSYMVEGIWPTVRDDDWCGEWKALVRRVDPVQLADVAGGMAARALPEGAIAAARVAAANLMSPLPAPNPSVAATATAFVRARGNAG